MLLCVLFRLWVFLGGRLPGLLPFALHLQQHWSSGISPFYGLAPFLRADGILFWVRFVGAEVGVVERSVCIQGDAGDSVFPAEAEDFSAGAVETAWGVVVFISGSA
jgi:hypothetical protein